MIYTTHLGEKLEREAAIAKQHNVPMLLDDAAGIPPIDNIKLYAKMKLDMYTFSGGKGLRGPQCSGVLLGRKDLIEAAMRNSCPFEGSVCRPMKVGKEEVIGCLTAIETWLKIDSKKLYEEWNERVDRIAKLVETVPGVQTEIYVPDDGNRYPTLRVSWDQQAGDSVSRIACRNYAMVIRSSKYLASIIRAWCPRCMKESKSQAAERTQRTKSH